MSGDSIRAVHPLFHVEGGGSTPTSPLQLTIYKIPLKEAIQLNKLWHSRLPKYGGTAKIAWGAVFNDKYYAIGIWSNPVARMLPQQTWLELRRLAISPDAPKNTASRMIKVMTTLIKKSMPGITTLISYQDTVVHKGTIYKAAGWTIGGYRAADEWNTPGRYRAPVQALSPKVRWQKEIRPPVEIGGI